MKQSNNAHPSYREARWHLLRVEKNGKLRPLVHFRGWVILLVGLILSMTVAVAWLLVAWLDARAALVTSQETVTIQERSIESMRDEKDNALARLAIAEFKLKALDSEPAMKKQLESPASKNGQQTLAKSLPGKGNTAEATPDNAPAKTISAFGAAPAVGDTDSYAVIEKVVADNLFVCTSPENSLLDIAFKVINMGTRKQPVSGRAFIILKDAYAQQDQWLVLPSAMLIDKRPVQSSGQRFQIYNYRTIKFQVAHENPALFVQATIFIYKDSGELIFERDFNLEPVDVCP